MGGSEDTPSPTSVLEAGQRGQGQVIGDSVGAKGGGTEVFLLRILISCYTSFHILTYISRVLCADAMLVTGLPFRASRDDVTGHWTALQRWKATLADPTKPLVKSMIARPKYISYPTVILPIKL